MADPTEVKLAGRLPGSFEMNGMTGIHDELASNDGAPRYAFLVYDVLKVDERREDGELIRTPIMRVRRIEPIPDGRLGSLREEVLKLAEERTGQAPLPLDAVDATDVRDLDAE